MSPAYVLGPTYQRLKRDLMAGAFPMGSKLEALRLADELGVSMTPVRDSLNQLTGEGLVEFSPGNGFRVARLSEQTLREMLDINHLLPVHALKTDVATDRLTVVETPKSEDHAGRASAIFGAIAAASGNRFLLRSVEQISARLNPVRRLEPFVIPSAPQRLLHVERSFGSARTECVSALSAYHSICLDAVPRLIASSPGAI
ncbi:GntR family transcriptional regulator [Erythrobacter sp. NE805]|uniref:GntR family transcriptional regulator n=1 Tax=Erythrobacter sp. NE805 TaxID=3389875 RepID=UPI00396B1C41